MSHDLYTGQYVKKAEDRKNRLTKAVAAIEAIAEEKRTPEQVIALEIGRRLLEEGRNAHAHSLHHHP